MLSEGRAFLGAFVSGTAADSAGKKGPGPLPYMLAAAPAVQALRPERVVLFSCPLCHLRFFWAVVRGRTCVSTVSLTGRRPKRMASDVLGTQMSILRPRTAPPVSATVYSPL